MRKIYSKIFSNPNVTIPLESLEAGESVESLGTKLSEKVKKLFRGSLAIREVDAGSTNAEEQEITALTNSYYDIERFGVHFVASPRHADMLFVTGPVSRNMAEALQKTYEATPDPKIVVAVGDDAIDGGVFRGSYGVMDGVRNVIPVDFEIQGDPPSPRLILQSLVQILGIIEEKNNLH